VELILVLIMKIFLELLLIRAIIKKARLSAAENSWARGIYYLFSLGLCLSAVNSLMIMIYSDATISKWSSPSQLIRGELIVLLWETAASLSFIYFCKARNEKAEKLVNIIYSRKGVVFIGIYSLLSIAIMIFFRLGYFEMGFTAITRGVQTSYASWLQLILEIPARIWFFPLGLLLVYGASRKDAHNRWLIISLVIISTGFILVAFWLSGARGTVLVVIAFFFVLVTTLKLGKRSLLLLAGVILLSLMFLIPTAQYRLIEDLGTQGLVEQFKNLQGYKARESTWESIKAGIEYSVYRLSPAEPGIFAEWVNDNSAYAGLNPLIGSSLGLVPRAIWPNKPTVGSASSSYLDRPEYITGRIMGTPDVTKAHTAGTNAFWIAWYPGVVFFAIIAGWYAAFVLRIGVINYYVGLLLLAITIAWGGMFLLMGIENLLAMLSQAIVPFFIVLLAIKILSKENAGTAINCS
jgi:hypothetical protein